MRLFAPMQATEEAAPQHAAIAKDGTLRTLLSLFMPHLQLTAQTMKLQANAGTLWQHVQDSCWLAMHDLVGCASLHYRAGILSDQDVSPGSPLARLVAAAAAPA